MHISFVDEKTEAQKKRDEMITKVLVEKNPWKMEAATGTTPMRRIPNAPSKGIMLKTDTISNAIFKGCDRARKQMESAGIE